METKLVAFCNELIKDIQNAYESSITLQEAEKLAAKFLHAQMLVAKELSNKDLDARMRKSGLKAIKSSVYLNAATQGDKKPSDTLLLNVVDQDKIVQESQTQFDKAEVSRDMYQNYLNIFKEAHVYFRQVSKGAFNG